MSPPVPRRAACWVFVLLVACAPERLTSTRPRLEVASERVDFPDTWVGATSSAELLLRNTGPVPLRVTLATAAPFEVASPTVELAAGEERRLHFGFLPLAEGPAQGVLVIDAPDGHRDVSLNGAGRVPPACAQAEACRRERFDAASGQCVAEPLADGTSCQAPCIEAGRCAQGQCIGAARRCDDGDACTRDSCSPTAGCIATPLACPPAPDSCQAAVCDRSKGCTFVEVEDGTLCGPSDCTTSHVCISGRCVARATPEGGACGEVSPCRAPGRCVAGTCEQPPASMLTPAWHYSAPAGWILEFGGVVDSDGNLAWLEHTDDTSWALVSLTPDGRLRFRKPFLASHPWMWPFLVAGRARLFVFHSGATVSAYHSADGSLLWERRPSRSGVLGPRSVVYEAGLGRTGPLLLLSDVSSQEISIWERALVALDPGTGALLWSQSISLARGLVIGEDGSVHVSGVHPRPGGDCCRGPALLSFTQAGTLTGNISAPSMCSGWWAGVDSPQATLAGTVLTWRYVYSPSGQQASPTLPFSFFEGHAVLSGTRGIAAGPPGDACVWPQVDSLWYPKQTPVQLTGFSWPQGAVLFQHPLPGVNIVSELQLTARGSVLFAQDTDEESSLHEVSLDGEDVMICPLPAGAHASRWKSSLLSPTLVGTNGFWVTLDDSTRALTGFRIRGIEPAASGWTTRGGSTRRGGSPD